MEQCEVEEEHTWEEMHPLDGSNALFVFDDTNNGDCEKLKGCNYCNNK